MITKREIVEAWEKATGRRLLCCDEDDELEQKPKGFNFGGLEALSQTNENSQDA